jgi:putative multiple sugar transport system ATP-binding protein
MEHITKDFFGVKALNNVDLEVKGGEIHAIVGENGAGKSTLMNVLSGTYPHGSYSGEIIIDRDHCKFSGIKDSEKKGVVIIHQELSLIPYMSIAENIFLGNERARRGIINWHITNRESEKYINMVSLKEDPSTLAKDIGIGKQQLVEIAKALAKEVRLLILDEPTAALNDNDSMYLLNLLLKLKEQGITVIIISHKLNEVCYVADRITVIRDGRVIETLDRQKEPFSENRIIQGMVGRELNERFPRRNSQIGPVVFEVESWNAYHPVFQERKIVDNLSVNVHKGEVVGIYGLMGAGRTEFVMSLFGRSYGYNISGTVKKDGKKIDTATVEKSIRNKLAMIPEDRKERGLNPIAAIKQNISIAGLDKISKNYIVNSHKEALVAHEYCQKLNIKSSGVNQKAESLSGGNQQKVVLAKWIFTHPDVLLLDEPTRGVDVGAKYEIYSIINSLIEEGACAIFISSDLTEVLGMCDRIYIMNEGKIVGEMATGNASQANIMELIIGSSSEKSGQKEQAEL